MKEKVFIKKLVKYSWVFLAVVFILYGVFAFLTPLTPGSWLFFAGLFIMFGRERTQSKLTRIVGKKWSGRLKMKKILNKIPKQIDHKS